MKKISIPVMVFFLSPMFTSFAQTGGNGATEQRTFIEKQWIFWTCNQKNISSASECESLSSLALKKAGCEIYPQMRGVNPSLDCVPTGAREFRCHVLSSNCTGTESPEKCKLPADFHGELTRKAVKLGSPINTIACKFEHHPHLKGSGAPAQKIGR